MNAKEKLVAAYEAAAHISEDMAHIAGARGARLALMENRLDVLRVRDNLMALAALLVANTILEG